MSKPKLEVLRSSGSNRQRFILWLGACAPTYFLVYAGGLEDALEECAEWAETNAPGLLCTEQVNEAYTEAYDAAIAEGLDEEDATERANEEATADTISLDCGRYIASDEWGIVAENPSRADILEFLQRPPMPRPIPPRADDRLPLP